jgi:hypothetical protein
MLGRPLKQKPYLSRLGEKNYLKLGVWKEKNSNKISKEKHINYVQSSAGWGKLTA